jgi:molybdopterin/thiamine biosynthesis adenylyltransferase
MQAAEALKLLMGIETTLCGKLLTINALNMQVRTMRLSKDADCMVCHHG